MNDYRAELARRDAQAQTGRMLSLTWVIAGLTLVNVALVALQRDGRDYCRFTFQTPCEANASGTTTTSAWLRVRKTRWRRCPLRSLGWGEALGRVVHPHSQAGLLR
jgi:hypothetical protein